MEKEIQKLQDIIKIKNDQLCNNLEFQAPKPTVATETQTNPTDLYQGSHLHIELTRIKIRQENMERALSVLQDKLNNKLAEKTTLATGDESSRPQRNRSAPKNDSNSAYSVSLQVNKHTHSLNREEAEPSHTTQTGGHRLISTQGADHTNRTGRISQTSTNKLINLNDNNQTGRTRQTSPKKLSHPLNGYHSNQLGANITTSVKLIRPQEAQNNPRFLGEGMQQRDRGKDRYNTRIFINHLHRQRADTRIN